MSTVISGSSQIDSKGNDDLDKMSAVISGSSQIDSKGNDDLDKMSTVISGSSQIDSKGNDDLDKMSTVISGSSQIDSKGNDDLDKMSAVISGNSQIDSKGNDDLDKMSTVLSGSSQTDRKGNDINVVLSDSSNTNRGNDLPKLPMMLVDSRNTEDWVSTIWNNIDDIPVVFIDSTNNEELKNNDKNDIEKMPVLFIGSDNSNEMDNSVRNDADKMPKVFIDNNNLGDDNSEKNEIEKVSVVLIDSDNSEDDEPSLRNNNETLNCIEEAPIVISDSDDSSDSDRSYCSIYSEIVDKGLCNEKSSDLLELPKIRVRTDLMPKDKNRLNYDECGITIIPENGEYKTTIVGLDNFKNEFGNVNIKEELVKLNIIKEALIIRDLIIKKSADPDVDVNTLCSLFKEKMTLLMEKIEEAFSEHRKNEELIRKEFKVSNLLPTMTSLLSLLDGLNKLNAEAVKYIKQKRWCFICGKKAVMYCCLERYYCNVECQKKDWLNHKDRCLQSTMSLNDPHLALNPIGKALLKEKANMSVDDSNKSLKRPLPPSSLPPSPLPKVESEEDSNNIKITKVWSLSSQERQIMEASSKAITSSKTIQEMAMRNSNTIKAKPRVKKTIEVPKINLMGNRLTPHRLLDKSQSYINRPNKIVQLLSKLSSYGVNVSEFDVKLLNPLSIQNSSLITSKTNVNLADIPSTSNGIHSQQNFDTSFNKSRSNNPNLPSTSGLNTKPRLLSFPRRRTCVTKKVSKINSFNYPANIKRITPSSNKSFDQLSLPSTSYNSSNNLPRNVIKSNSPIASGIYKRSTSIPLKQFKNNS
ncbi:hypothetical protein O3M35_004001 [Rhynocoris fuscipes]|uniref:MYND-type domain-containing protein n=1 Tax=Rhynocoris fuscipes TaxID=488301 RepID=A0AAW1CI86_9HEMI